MFVSFLVWYCLFLCFYYKYMTLIVLFFFFSSNIDGSPLFCVIATSSQSRAHTVITRSHWHAQFYCSLFPHFILARRKNFITLYHDFIVSVLQLRSFVFVFLFYTESLRVSQCKSLFVLFCNVGFCFVFLFCMYLSNVRLLFFVFI